jgi:23S rRNA pseudouridine2605 synthase
MNLRLNSFLPDYPFCIKNYSTSNFKKINKKSIGNNSKEGLRISKFIARCGVCSRREAESWILMGRITVDGKKIESPNLDVLTSSEVCVDGKKIEIEKPRLFIYYKRPNILTTLLADPKNRATLGDVINSVPGLPDFLMPVGRLDFLSEGLLLLSNDGDLSRYLELPSSKITRKYEIQVRGKLDEDILKSLNSDKGFVIEGWRYKPMIVELKKRNAKGVQELSSLTVTLTEGKNREIRRVFAHFGFQVRKLVRTHYGPYSLLNLLPGDIQEVPVNELLLSNAKLSTNKE